METTTKNPEDGEKDMEKAKATNSTLELIFEVMALNDHVTTIKESTVEYVKK